MKKKLESELISIAHRILKLTGKEDLSRMHEEVAQLYEKLTVLKFAQENFENDTPTIGNNSSFFDMLDTAFNNKVSDTIEVENKVYTNIDERDEDAIMEPVMNKIKDMVAFMPEDDTTDTDNSLNLSINGGQPQPVDFETLTKNYGHIPEFEPLEEALKRESQTKTTLNNQVKGNGLQLDLNDKHSFIKHLFNGKSEDYDRVISQINTITSLQDAKDFIYQLVKPDYNNWEDKADYEAKFMKIIEQKFQ